METKAIEKYGDEFGRKYVVGTGPFKFASWKTGKEKRLAATTTRFRKPVLHLYS